MDSLRRYADSDTANNLWPGSLHALDTTFLHLLTGSILLLSESGFEQVYAPAVQNHLEQARCLLSGT